MVLSSRPGTVFVVLVLLLFTLQVSQWQCEAAIDCRRFVFAPICRGASAKRAALATMPIDELKLNNRLEPYRKNYGLRLTPNDVIQRHHHSSSHYMSN